jgi:hypothetical protein
MFSDSIILYGIGKLILKIKNDYKKAIYVLWQIILLTGL